MPLTHISITPAKPSVRTELAASAPDSKSTYPSPNGGHFVSVPVSARFSALQAGRSAPWTTTSLPTESLGRELAQRTGISLREANSFLWTNLVNGGATLRGDKDRRTFTAAEAYRFMVFVRKGSNFQADHLPSPLALARFRRLSQPAAQLFLDRFFGGRLPTEQNAAQVGLDRPIRIQELLSVHDGDTWRARYLPYGSDKPRVASMRFSAYDAPEVAGSKLKRQLDGLLKEFSAGVGKTFGTREREELRQALKEHLVYQGDLTGLMWNDFVKWATQRGSKFELAPSFIHGADTHTACGMYDMVGFNGRLIGIPQVSDPHILARYMRERLPQLMATQGEELLQKHLRAVMQDPNLPDLIKSLRSLGDAGVEMAKLIDPTTWVKPSIAFSPPKMSERAASWQRLTRTNSTSPERRAYSRDLSAATIHLGLGYHYVKYRAQRSPFYEFLERGVKERGGGLWSNPLFRKMEYTKDPGECHQGQH